MKALARLAAVLASPGRLFFGPVFDKELRVSGRRTSTFVVRLGFGLLLLIVTSIAFAGLWDSQWNTGNIALAMRVQSMAPNLARVVTWVQFIAAILIAPAITSATISEERRRQTLSAVVTSPLTASQIIYNKITAAMINLVILLLLGMPLLLAIRAFGGLPLERLLAGAALTLSVAFLGLSIGTSVSALRKPTRGAMMTSLVIMVGVLFLPSLLYLGYSIAREVSLSTGAVVSLPALPTEWPPQTCAPIMLGYLEFEVIQSIDQVRGMWLRCVAWTVSLGFLFSLQAVYRLRKLIRTDPTGTPLTSQQRRAQKRAKQQAKRAARRTAKNSSAHLGDAVEAGQAEQAEAQPPKNAKGRKIRKDRDRSRDIAMQPVLWRELRQTQFGSLTRLILMSALAVLLVGFAYVNSSISNGVGWNSTRRFGPIFEGEGVHILVCLVCLGFLLLQAATTTTSGVTSERESRTWDVLLTTRMSPRQIMLGKLVGSLRRLWFLPVIVVIHTVLALGSGYMSPAALPILIAAFVPTTIMLCCTGLAFSLTFRKTITAAALNLGFVLLLWIGIPLVIGFVGQATNLMGYDWYERLFGAYVLTIPFVVVVQGLQEFTGEQNIPVFNRMFWIGPGDTTYIGLLVRLAIYSITQLAIGGLALLMSFGRFNRVTGRTS